VGIGHLRWFSCIIDETSSFLEREISFTFFPNLGISVPVETGREAPDAQKEAAVAAGI
jgi:hypothetical protein